MCIRDRAYSARRAALPDDRTGRARGDRRGLRVRRVDRVRPGGESDAHHQGDPRRDTGRLSRTPERACKTQRPEDFTTSKSHDADGAVMIETQTLSQQQIQLAEQVTAHNYHPLPVVIESAEGALSLIHISE